MAPTSISAEMATPLPEASGPSKGEVSLVPSPEEGQERAWRQLQKLLAGKGGQSTSDLFDEEDFRISAGKTEGSFTAENPGQEFGVTFRKDGAIALDSRRTAKWDWSIRSARANDAAWEAVSATRMQRQIAEGITEWYLNEARGLEQGYTIQSKEADPGRIEVSFSTSLDAEIVPDGGSRRIAFRDTDGREVLTYHGLVVTDATGRELPSRIELVGSPGDSTTVALHYDARDAAYPVTVDPWVSTELALFPGSGGSYPYNFTEVMGEMYFRASDGSSGTELWKSDGTAAGTVLVKDINPGCESSSPEELTAAGSRIFFRARTMEHGEELWVSDGTAAGTHLVVDLGHGTDGYGGPRSSWPSHFCAASDGTVFFTAEDINNERRLWRSDGTEAGTVLVENITEGGPLSPQSITAIGDQLFFSASSPSKGYELWKCETPDSVPEVVKDISPGTDGSFPESLTAVNGTLFFTAGNQYNYSWDYRNRELWKSDGTEMGTMQVTDIAPGSGTSDPYGMTEFNGELYFRARSSGYNYELWKADGMGSYSLVKDIYPGSNASYPYGFTVAGGLLFFQASDGTHGYELWATDGTPNGTNLVADINPGSNGSDPYYFTSFNGQLYFAARDGDMDHGRELWRSDGTEAGTEMVKDIWPGFNEGGYANNSYPEYLALFGDKILFNARNPEGHELWATDGTEAGTMLVKNISPTPFYYGDDSAPERGEVFESSYDYDDQFIVPSGDLVYFAADDGVHGWELWASDGTAGGTRLVLDIFPGTSNSWPRNLTDYNGTLIFSANDSDSRTVVSAPEEGPASGTGRELWRSDGTAAGTVLIKDLWPGTYSSQPENLMAVGGYVYFSAEVHADNPPSAPEVGETIVEGDYGRELWRTDGTEEGTLLVKDIYAGSNGSYPDDFIELGGLVYFRADDGAYGNELWKTDGTEGGTEMVADIEPGGNSSSPYYLVSDGQLLFFRAYSGTYGYELWRSDGTEAGTFIVADIQPGGASSYPEDLTIWNDTLFFKAYTDQTPTSAPENGILAPEGTGSELWKSDGTEEGTVLVKDIRPGEDMNGNPFSSDPRSFTSAAGQLFFIADDGEHGRELWKTDGSEAGTVLVRDIMPGLGQSCVNYLEEYAGMLVFAANDGVTGYEAWVSDGTTAGTGLAEDLIPGFGGSAPIAFTVFKGQLLYWAGTERGTSLRLVGGSPPKPDLLLGLGANRGAMIGDDLYRSSARRGLVNGQTQNVRIANQAWRTVYLLIENDGEGVDQIAANAGGLRNRNTRVECHELGGGTPVAVTGAILSGNYEHSYRPGESRLVRVRIRNQSTEYRRVVRSNALVRVASVNDGAARDLGAIRTVLRPAVPLDRTR